MRIDAAPVTQHIELLEDAGWSRTAIAAITGVGITTVYRLAWGQPKVHATTARYILAIQPGPGADVDEAVVLRVLAGDLVPTTAAERREIVARWHTTGRPINDLEDLTGWKPERYRSREQAGAA